ncbi:hypothetical protein I2I05_05165 [Hymenobacter sp. BT683]|uniref:Uncharacterized protein n=1 Tax=Hymenobacter jeongseonensis TaxID=2791027 RepID=A0ABS0IEJ4_9BACT|nr:hypothetical protein [Hymenobacter jeongseonensis]MBF9236778.1 hypothetical protein [Hymenobacter jeongseonensis]
MRYHCEVAQRLRNGSMEKKVINAKLWRFDEKSVFVFGKHIGKTVQDVFKSEPSYIMFCLCDVSKFVLSQGGYDALKSINGNYIKDNKAFTSFFLNKIFELNRIVGDNTYLASGREKKTSFFDNYLIHFDGDKPLMYTHKRAKSWYIGNSCGETVEVNDVYPDLRRRGKSISKQHNEFNFSINIIDYKDLKAFRKYERSYANPGIRNFEIAANLGCGLIVLVVSMEWHNLSQDPIHRFFGSSSNIRLIPDDSPCVMHIIKSHYSGKTKVGVIDDVDTEGSSRELDANYNKTDVNSRAGIMDGLPELLKELLETYSLYRQAFPNKNLFNNTSLYYKRNNLKFTLSWDEVNKLIAHWYALNNDLKTYESRQKRIFMKILEQSGYFESDYSNDDN